MRHITKRSLEAFQRFGLSQEDSIMSVASLQRELHTVWTLRSALFGYAVPHWLLFLSARVTYNKSRLLCL